MIYREVFRGRIIAQASGVVAKYEDGKVERWVRRQTPIVLRDKTCA